MPTFDAGTILKGLNDYIDYQKAQKVKQEKATKIKEIIDWGKQSGADITIDFDDEGNIKPKVTYKHKSAADQMLEMLDVKEKVNKYKESEQKSYEQSKEPELGQALSVLNRARAGGVTPQYMQSKLMAKYPWAMERIKNLTVQPKTQIETLRNRILAKIAKGIPLTPGEQKIYDDVIKKQQQGGSIWDTVQGGGQPTTPPKKSKYIVTELK